jgi:hypothetical protein
MRFYARRGFAISSRDSMMRNQPMTKIQLHFDLERPLDEALMERIAKANAVYGIERIFVAPTLDALTVEYDATRLNPMEVEAVLQKRGIPALIKR